MCVRVRVCVCARACVCVRACVCANVHVGDQRKNESYDMHLVEKLVPRIYNTSLVVILTLEHRLQFEL